MLLMTETETATFSALGAIQSRGPLPGRSIGPYKGERTRPGSTEIKRCSLICHRCCVMVFMSKDFSGIEMIDGREAYAVKGDRNVGGVVAQLGI